jgi:hypothetical protein
MLKTIAYTFPQTASDTKFFKNLVALLGQLPNATIEQNSISLTAIQPKQALPVTIFRQGNVPFPQVHFDGSDNLQLKLGNFAINPDQDVSIDTVKPLPKTIKHDGLGEYFEVDAGGQVIFRLPITELCSRLQGHITRIDHTGINLPSALTPKDTWEQFISKLAASCNLYRYPTGEDWPFILPATKYEFAHDIQSFPVGREPKFELVYDTFSPVPTIQIDIETDLLRTEIEQLFPEPYGVSFPDLADYFRTVYIDHDWPGLAIRFDLRFKNDDPAGDWETGAWLVNDGGRLR